MAGHAAWCHGPRARCGALARAACGRKPIHLLAEPSGLCGGIRIAQDTIHLLDPRPAGAGHFRNGQKPLHLLVQPHCPCGCVGSAQDPLHLLAARLAGGFAS